MCGGEGIAQVQVAVVAGDVLVAQRQLQTAQRQVFHAVRAFHEVLVDELGSFTFLAVEDQLAHLLQVGLRLGAVVVVGLSAPEGLFVQLNLLGVGAAIDHRPQMGVAHRQRLQPVTGGTAVPQLVLLRSYAAKEKMKNNK